MKDHEMDEGDDAALAALRQVANRATVRSVKETILTCLLIRAVRPRRRRAVIFTMTLSAGLASAHYWHAWSVVAHLVH
jgi:hypothetical protein